MAESPAAAKAARSGGSSGSLLDRLAALLNGTQDVAVALGVVAILLMLILPVPGWLLDFGLAISITLSVLILMTSFFIEKPLQLSSFPTILLIATMLRLGLNLASTRLILGYGHEGTGAAGGVIEAFGTFLMGGETLIGITIFAILVIINFIVITKGAGRIAEVAARFSLDAMPGKQMAIDADLSAGLIDENQARQRRTDLENESTFFGSMDGASKFVKGDAIAGLIITFVNIIVGLVIGISSKDMAWGDAFATYTVLTVGDGLVSQIPALIVSTAAGLLVTKGGVTGKTDEALVGQLTAYPKALGTASALLLILGLMPGLPFVPFAAMAALLGVTAYMISTRRAGAAAITAEEKRKDEIAAAVPKEEPISASLAMDQIRLELGYGLLNMLNGNAGDDYQLTDQIKALRRQLAGDYGFIMPSVRILDNMALPANTYVIYIKETEVGRGDLNPGMLLVMHPSGEQVNLPGEDTLEPAFGLPAMWVDPTLRDEASFRGYTVVDTPTVVTTHLTEAIKDNIPELLSYVETQKLLNELGPDTQKLVSELIPDKVSVSGVQRVLQNLLGEQVSIRDLPAILEGIAEACGYTQNLVMMTEHVRARLARQISAANARDGIVPLVTLSPQWEQRFGESLMGNGDERQLAMSPSDLQGFIGAVRDCFETQAASGQLPCLLTSPAIRPYVRSVIERFRPATVVLSQNEIHPKAKVRALGAI